MTPILKADGVSYAVQSRTLVSRVDLRLHPGEVLAIVGPNGAGKSTLCGLLAGDLTPTEGAVELCGRPVPEAKPADLAHLRAMLTQQTYLRFPFTALEVVLMGRYPHIRRWRAAAATDYDMAEDAMRSVQVWHLKERIYATLSGGEQRRVSIARVLAQDTPVIMLDEPSASLDIGHQQLVMELCRQLADGGRAVLTVLHDLNLAGAFADRVMVMSDGKMVTTGTPDDALRPELLSAVFHQEVLVMPHPQTNRPVVLAAYGNDSGKPSGRRSGG